jgi:hypothetical protein
MPKIEGLMALLADFDIIAKAGPAASKSPAVTPLGEWVASLLARRCAQFRSTRGCRPKTS